ncbi:D-3-phosphoglycerate dehydrogenase [Candidatus Peribacteria bacterium RIFCSPLOWO2_01_FULL_51_18]|nr:MAG: D-3-phosphoglycerate dehydrogenase [Candidatus Peribacteria bacterium RIFCSPHIGHO2_02_FULL_51_15]OGJ65997.1 MAG: D-3-phosphoglycerate dehydrogenase [Candidatus Peribacteria bacterium RIFCSPLOWO2_01_FULL_51_18]OGJ68120.1 MAG: D-3-phosphoglycerate dehydrogenase [Candidatus Peribacteria bacterium RIFCSPLOWO2_02_FULL_51_10]
MTTSFPKSKIKVLLLGGIHKSARDVFHASGYGEVELLDKELTEQELKSRIGQVHLLGIRSATRITPEVISKARKLLAIGCFCIGTNQVDLKNAKLAGIPVFNAPFSNTRSVAELVIAEVIMLLRDIPSKNFAAHRGEWRKSSKSSYEVRGKTLGIIGYGHIGTQAGILAEALGMRVLYFDIESKLSIGNAQPVATLKEILAASDVITLHVPGGTGTRHLIGLNELKSMKRGACLINASRGHVVDIEALASLLRRKHLSGAALDVYPEEPASTGERFFSELQKFENTILTPHVAGSTLEAQERIGREVAEKIVLFSDTGSTAGSVNFLDVTLPSHSGKHRILHIHHNQPGVLAAINEAFANAKVNIAGQFLQTDQDIGYVVTDIDQRRGLELRSVLQEIPGTIRTRILY